ncbi:V0 complex, c/d subunit of ATPase [Syncephalis fuscata]|nr:V0 complex, c/d subunit of ATPase [Syncephalis fuscata]
MEALMFNVDDGYLEGIVRGYRSGLLSSTNYLNLTQCESLDDLKLQLSATDYGNLLQNEPSPLATSTIAEKCTEQLVEEFQYMRQSAVAPLSKFLDFMTYGYMIDNVILLITGTLHDRDTHELLDRCHPLGIFDAMPALCAASTVSDIYHTVLVETPLAPYFQGCLSAHDLDELNIEIIRNTLYKAYLEDFYQFCTTLNGPTGEIMTEILEFEADRRTINITANSFGTELTKEDRSRLFPNTCDDVDAVKGICEQYSEYRGFFDTQQHRSLEDNFFFHEVHLNKLAFQQQFHYGKSVTLYGLPSVLVNSKRIESISTFPFFKSIKLIV